MKKSLQVMAAALLLAVFSNGLFADALADQKKAQSKLLAQRAARADAMRKLAERIRGLKISSETYVRDFVAESDTIQTSLDAWLTGCAEVGKPKHMEDGTCEVTMEVALTDVVVSLKQIRNRYYKGDKFRAEDFDQILVNNEVKVLTETGMGAPRPELDSDAGMSPVSKSQALDSLSHMGASAKAYWMANVMPQGRLMAVRAARVDGMRRLAERIKGVHITSETTVQDFVAESDEINVDMNTFLAGAREMGVKYHDDEPVVEVQMEVTLRTVYAALKQWSETHYHGDKMKMKKLEELNVTSQDTIIKETGMGIPPQKYLKGQVTAEEYTAIEAGAQLPDWVSETFRATGNAVIDNENSNAAQAKLMAMRAAELDARRKLAEQINGLRISSSTNVQDFVAQNDEIRTSMLAYQQGARVIESSKKIAEDGTVECVVEIELRPLWDMVVYYEKNASVTVR